MGEETSNLRNTRRVGVVDSEVLDSQEVLAVGKAGREREGVRYWWLA